ncbi:hypothetical protein [Larkinella ripae]
MYARKNYHHFRSGTCKAVQKIEIRWFNQSEYYPEVSVDGRVLTHDEVDLLAKNDGFDRTTQFFDWFNTDFAGKIIHWTDLRY